MTMMASFTPVLFILWLGLTAATSVVDLQKRVIGGTTCGPNERNYHVRLETSDGKTISECGGSLISDEWILTAAHCWKEGRSILAHLGSHPSGGNVVKIKENPYIFKDKDVKNKERIHDIMLLRLSQPSKIAPVVLPNCANRPTVGATVQVAGHGATAAGKYNERVSGESISLQCANTKVVDCQWLQNIVRSRIQDKMYQHWFCGQSPQVDICPGDSGGAVVYNNMIHGVIGFTGDPFFACSEAAGIMDVCEYINWIRDTMATPRKGSKLSTLLKKLG